MAATHRRLETGGGWLNDFRWSDGRLLIRKTGVRLSLDGPLFAEVLAWIPYLARLGLAAMVSRLSGGGAVAIWYEPDVPRPWYLMRGAALWAGMRVARTPAEAAAAFHFEDVTRAEPRTPPTVPSYNYGCTDISKSRVAAVFEEVFGYALSVDPLTHGGPVVEKPEKNGVHGARVMAQRGPARPGHVYQRLVDTADGAGRVADLRTLCAGGRPLFVWRKLKAAGASFAIHSLRTTLHEPDDVFSPPELRLIGRFIERMGLDWGGLDILRDRASGRIYIVDVNMTDLVPVISLSWRDKVRSMRRLAAAMRALTSSHETAAPAVLQNHEREPGIAA